MQNQDDSAPARTLEFVRRGGRRYLLPWLSIHRWRRRFLLVFAALVAGLLAILFAIGAEHAIDLHARMMAVSPWLTLLIAPAGFAAMTWIARRFVPATQGSGIPQAIAATMSDDRRVRRKLLSFKIAVAKVVLTLGGLLSGASIGREGPSVQIGASIMHMLAGRRKNRSVSSRDLIIAGSGAGVAAAFNTPLGGIMFAIEEMCRYRAFQANSATLTAVIFAGLTSLAVLGSYTYFGRAAEGMDWSHSLWPTLICGIAGGLLGGLFSRLLIASSRGLPGRVGELSANRPVLFAACCGLGTAVIGLGSGGLTYGTGYGETRAALEGSALLPVWFLFAKMLVIWLAFMSRIPGGVFAPALAVGAGLGANIAAFLPPEQATAVLTLGMVAFLSGMTQTPITAFVIVMEMTANHQMLIPLMATSVIAHGISRSVCPVSLYHALAQTTLRKVVAEVRAASVTKRTLGTETTTAQGGSTVTASTPGQPDHLLAGVAPIGEGHAVPDGIVAQPAAATADAGVASPGADATRPPGDASATLPPEDRMLPASERPPSGHEPGPIPRA